MNLKQLLDGGVLVYVVIAFVPNMLLMLWVMARMHRDIRIVTAKLGVIESDNRVLDEGLKALADEVRQLRLQGSEPSEVRQRIASKS